jgi:hypothetical protein
MSSKLCQPTIGPRVAGAESVPATVNEEEGKPLPALSLDDVLTKTLISNPSWPGMLADVRNAAMKNCSKTRTLTSWTGWIFTLTITRSQTISESMLRQMASLRNS